MTRNQAKMIAEELYKMIRKDVLEASIEIAKDESEEYLCAKEAAALLGWKPDTLYRNKDKVGCYVKMNGQLRFSKSRLHKVIQSGLIR